MNPNLAALAKHGQSVWIDYIRRGMLERDELAAMIADGVLGLTSNPTIFQKAIAESDDYSEPFERLAREGRSAVEIYEALVFQDIRDAADLMAPVYRRTDRSDGFVSIEVSPTLAHDTLGTLTDGRRIFRSLSRPNIMIKVPATAEGLPAIEALLAEGIHVNVTLIFSVSVYKQVIESYLRGIRRWIDGGGDPAGVASVASFFVSRIDTAVDQQLEKRIAAGDASLAPLLGQAAIANARLAYVAFQEIFESASGLFGSLKARGARVQRPLWASTGTKNPRYRDTYYVDTLVGTNTVNTLPPATLEAVRRGLKIKELLPGDVAAARSVMERLTKAGVHLDAVTSELTRAGVTLFADSFESLMGVLESRRSAFMTPRRTVGTF